MAGHQSAGRLSEVVDQIDLEKFANAYYEADEFIRIYEGLNTARDKSFVSRLKYSMRGHEFHVMDEDDRSGRDISFELSMAATFSRVADYMNFGHRADLEMKVNDVLYYVECKRLKSKGHIALKHRFLYKRAHVMQKAMISRYVDLPRPMLS
jgi:hypothetical protein